ncbi:hypothetical protein B0H13DRAFT_2330319 [Mycena leptocephala]|nr:hypothetical protein B0H13DRAFT_2330319 [Mycena leptocephala]
MSYFSSSLRSRSLNTNQPQMADGSDSVTFTIGALIAGCMTSVGLSAIVGFQTFLYFQVFPMDTLPYKALVAWICEQAELVADRAVWHVVSSEDRTRVMFITKAWSPIASRFKDVLVCAWAVSAATDILISAARYYYLRDLKQGYMSTQEMVDAVVIFTINDGLLTCATLIATIACFLSMPTNYIWLSIYFTLSKLFSNSVLAT